MKKMLYNCLASGYNNLRDIKIYDFIFIFNTISTIS